MRDYASIIVPIEKDLLQKDTTPVIFRKLRRELIIIGQRGILLKFSTGVNWKQELDEFKIIFGLLNPTQNGRLKVWLQLRLSVTNCNDVDLEYLHIQIYWNWQDMAQATPDVNFTPSSVKKG